MAKTQIVCMKTKCNWHKGRYGIKKVDEFECGLPAISNDCEEWKKLRKESKRS